MHRNGDGGRTAVTEVPGPRVDGTAGLVREGHVEGREARERRGHEACDRGRRGARRRAGHHQGVVGVSGSGLHVSVREDLGGDDLNAPGPGLWVLNVDVLHGINRVSEPAGARPHGAQEPVVAPVDGA